MNKAYPPIKVEKENIEYANMLLDDYTGLISELSAILQYTYQQISKFNTDILFSKTLREIAIVEMKHLDLLGKTINLLGKKPEFKYLDKCMITYWNSSYINYESDIRKMLFYNIKTEQEAIKNYQRHIRLINDKYIKILLYRIIEDEEEHIECFKNLLKIYNKKREY